MIDGHFTLAVTSGMLAAVNPCGFAMLPAYLSYFLGLSGESRRSTAATLARALVVSLTLLTGFLVVFGSFGVIIRGIGFSQSTFQEYSRWPATAIGVVLIFVGVAMAAGWHVPLVLPRMDLGGKDTTLRSMFVFGVSFAITSLGCGTGPFMSTVVGSFGRQGFVSGVSVFVAYGVGMGMLVGAVTVSMAVAQQGFLRLVRRAMPYAERVTGGLLVFAGAYLVYYWAFNGGERTGWNPVNTAQSNVETWLADRSTASLIGAFGGIVAIAVIVVLVSWARAADESEKSTSDVA